MEFPEELIHPEHVKFLQTDEGAVNEDASRLAHIRFEYTQKLAEAWGEEQTYLYYMRECKGWAHKMSADLEGTIEKAKWMAPTNHTYKESQKLYVNASIKRRKIQGYLDSLDFKASFIPGWQGRENRSLEYDNNEGE